MYVFDLVLKQLLGIEYDLTTDAEQFKAFDEPKMHYGMQRLGDEPFVKAVDILFERHIHEQTFRTVEFEGTVAPYAVYGQGNLLPFDVFAASFFLVSRYEEYLSQVRDQYGRFRAESTWMFENGMLQKPLVNIWALALGNKLKAIFPNLELKLPKFTFIPTYDVDAAWAYKCKGLYRTVGGFLKDLTSGDRERIRERDHCVAHCNHAKRPSSIGVDCRVGRYRREIDDCASRRNLAAFPVPAVRHALVAG